MKNHLFALTCFTIIFLNSSCAQIFIEGNGNVIKKELHLTDFNALDVSRGFNILLKQDTIEKVVVEIDENLHPYVEAKVKSGVLVISAQTRIKNVTKMNVFITARNIDQITLNGGGSLLGENNFKADQIKLDMNGGGNLNMELQASKIIVSMNGGGKLKMNANSKSLVCKLQGGGNSELSGKVEMADFNLNGGGNILASELIIEDANVQINGGSNSTLKVKNTLSGEINGGGDLILIEKPLVNNVITKGGSNLMFK